MSSNTRFPSKLIELCAGHGTQPSLRVVAATIKHRYAALSYCWGGDQPFKLTSARLGHAMKSVDAKSLPQTIMDAIKVAVELGIDFLWIDSMCIVQDDPADVARELDKMAEIYQGAVFTISAASASSASGGFLKPRQRQIQSVPRFHLSIRCSDGNLGTAFLLPGQSTYGYHSWEMDPINSRAWTLQEHVLSRRILYYSSQQLHWICKEEKLSDGGQSLQLSGLPPFDEIVFSFALNVTAIPTTLRGDPWKELLGSYSARTLSDPAGRLVAISGIGREFARLQQTSFVAGLFEATLSHNLCWSRAGSPARPRPPKYRAPTWSWAAIDGQIDWSEHTEDWGEMLEIVSWKVEHIFPDAIYGPIKSAELRLHAWTARATLSKEPKGNGQHIHRITLANGWYNMIGSHSIDAVQPELESPGSLAVWLIVVLRSAILHADRAPAIEVLLAISEPEGNERYSRIGFCSLRVLEAPVVSAMWAMAGTYKSEEKLNMTLRAVGFEKRTITLVRSGLGKVWNCI